ncbi:hypothetical protein MOUN0_I08768 [Monosporozyma unispora]|nr:hypothetical protein C6P44_003609 [Kazachstania unispora]
MTSVKKDFITEDTKSIYSDDTTLLNYTLTNNNNINTSQSYPPNKSNIPRYFKLDNLKNLLNKPYKHSRRLNPCQYHSINNNTNNNTNTQNHIYDSYIQYEDEISHRNKLPQKSNSTNYKYIKHTQNNEELILNEKMIEDFWLDDTIPNEMDFELSSDEEDFETIKVK